MKNAEIMKPDLLKQLEQISNPEDWCLAEHEGEANRAILSDDGTDPIMIADCYAPTHESVAPPCDYQANARFLLHAAKSFRKLYEALVGAQAVLGDLSREDKLSEKEDATYIEVREAVGLAESLGDYRNANES